MTHQLDVFRVRRELRRQKWLRRLDVACNVALVVLGLLVIVGIAVSAGRLARP